MNTEHNKNKLYWQSDLYPEGKVEVQLTLATYADNDNLYVGLICPCEEEEDEWESFTDLTINQHSLPPLHAYVDHRDYNKGAHEFLIRYGIAHPCNEFPQWNGFKLFRFNRERLEELAPEYYRMIARKLPPDLQALETVEYQGQKYPLRKIKDTSGFYLIATQELEKELLNGIGNDNTQAEEIHGNICHYCTEEEIKSLTDEEMIKKINSGIQNNHAIISISRPQI